MKILVFHQFYTCLDEPGIARFNVLGRHWIEDGHKVMVIAGMINYITGKKDKRYGGKLFAEENDGGVRVTRVWSTTFYYRRFYGRVSSYLSFYCSSFLAGLFAGKADVIIASSPTIFMGVIAYVICVIKGKPFVLELRDLWPDEVVEQGTVKNPLILKISYALEKFLYKKARFIVVNSPGFKEFLIQRKGIGENKIGVVENPIITGFVNIKNRDEVREKMGWRNKFVVLYGGSLSLVYDFSPVLDAAKELIDKKDILFVFVGDGRQKSGLMERVKSENIKNIVFFDPVPNSRMGELFAAADIGIVPLKSANLLRYVYASKIFGYFAAGRPVVLGMEGVSRELVCEKAKAGICVPPGDSDAVRKATISLYEKRNVLSEMGENGRRYVELNFSASVLAKRYLDLLKPVVVPQGKGN